MMNKFFRRSTINLISTLTTQNNILKFQFNCVKFFGAKKKSIIGSADVIKKTKTPETEKIQNKSTSKKKQKVIESSSSSSSSSKEEDHVNKKSNKSKQKLEEVRGEKHIKKSLEKPKNSLSSSSTDKKKIVNKQIIKDVKTPAAPAKTQVVPPSKINIKKTISSILAVRPSTITKEKSSVLVETKKVALNNKNISKSLEKPKTNIKDNKDNKVNKVKISQVEKVDKKAPQKKIVVEEIIDKTDVKKRAVRTPKSEEKKINYKDDNKNKVEVVEKQQETPEKKIRTSSNTKKLQEPFPLPDLKSEYFKLGWISTECPLKMYHLKSSGMYGIYEDYIKNHIPTKSKELILKEQMYGCNNYAPLPIVIQKGNGVFLKDVENNTFIDFLAAYSAMNHGHNNQNVIKDMFEQANILYMTSRAFYNNKLGEASELICNVFGYEKVLFMNGGVEAGESAVKIARRWGYKVKNIAENQAKIVFAKGNFWGRTTYACATSDDPSRYEGFGPLQKDSHYLVDYNSIPALEQVLIEDERNICAVFLEPIQGENGVIIPDKGYLSSVAELCKKHNVLFIADEIQTGCGRAGHLLYCNEEGVKPDLVCLGKSLSSGLYPVSAVLSSRNIMDLINPGEHGSTYGGNPLAASVVMSSIRDILNKQLVENSYDKGLFLGNRLMELKDSKIIKEIRGRGLMYGLEFHEDLDISAYHFSVWLMERGILTKPTKKNILRLTPPISISTEEINAACDILIAVVRNAEKLLLDDYVDRPKPVFNFTKVDEDYHKLLDKSMNKNEAEGKKENQEIASTLKKNSFSLETPTYNESKDLKGEHILDQIIKSNVGKNNSNANSIITQEEFDPNPYLKNNLNKLDEQLFANDEDDHKRKLTELLFTYLENPFKYDKEDASIGFNKDLDLNRLLVRTLDHHDIMALDKKINLTSNLEIQNKNLYKKIVSMIQDFKDYSEAPTDNNIQI